MTTNLERDAVWHGKDLQHAIDAAGVALRSGNVDTDRLAMEDAPYKLWGVPRTGDVTFEDLFAHIHPADRDRVRAAFAATRASGAVSKDNCEVR